MARPTGTKLIAENRRARHDYELIERLEAGVVLTGTEVKSLRAGHVQLGQAYADVRGGDVWLVAIGGCSCTAARSTASTARCGRRA
jgi:SsrA-binding protein